MQHHPFVNTIFIFSVYFIQRYEGECPFSLPKDALFMKMRELISTPQMRSFCMEVQKGHF